MSRLARSHCGSVLVFFAAVGVGSVSAPSLTAGEPVTPIGEGKPVEVILEKVVTEAVSGDPLGAGRVELNYVTGHGPVIYPDQSLILVATDQRARYVTFDVDYQSNGTESNHQVKRIEASFLLSGDQPIEFTLRGPNGKLLQEDIEPIVGRANEANRLRRQWWKTFASISADASEPERQLHDALIEILARRHGLSLPNRSSQKAATQNKDLKGLEGQFERAVGMLFGIESVKLAMQEDVSLRESTRLESANQPVPKRPRISSLLIPKYQPVPIEPIAMRVPAECFYLRTGDLTNYFRFRDFLTGWGGSLDDIVSPRAFDYDLRRKIEMQLGLDTTTMKPNTWNDLVSDMALIGCDPLFHDGAAVGVLMEATDSKALLSKVQRHRIASRDNNADAEERRIKIKNRWVSMLSTPDFRVRSFYVIDGRYHLLTNSEHLLNRFLDTANGGRSLGQLNEFGYAKSKTKFIHGARAFLYLSDPFFQNLISPQYRIEMTRRAAAKRDLRKIQLAQLVAEAEQIDARSVDDFVSAKLLPQDFRKRPDGSSVVYRKGRSIDSVRGASGTFLPVPDVPLTNATWTEVSGYKSFIANYNREWGRIDPVTVVFSEDDHRKRADLDQFKLDIVVAPYARRRYDLLDTHLADANKIQLSPVAGDLISVQAAVRLNRHSRSHLLSIGLQDADVPFVLEDGGIKRLGSKPDTTFAKARSYAAITPPKTDVLRMLASVLLEGESPRRATPSPTPVQPRRRLKLVPLSTSTPAPMKAIYYMAWAFANMPPGTTNAIKYLSMIETRNDITVVSESGEVRDKVHLSVSEQPVGDPHEISLQVASLEGSKVEPYIQAFTYLEARRGSTQNASFLNRWSDWLRLPPTESRNVIEELLGAKVLCPLGGIFVLTPSQGQKDWASTAWTAESRYELDSVPADWKFPFLNWLQALSLDFDLGKNTLTASVELTTRNLHGAGEPLTEISEALANKVESRTRTLNEFNTDEMDQDSFGGEEEGEWILGLRIRHSTGQMTVSSIYPGSPASRYDIRAGDVIQKVNKQIPASREILLQAIRESQREGFVWIELNRNGSKIRMRIQL